MTIRDRIIDFRRVPVAELLTNAGNFRTHPSAQRDALAGSLREIGIAQALVAYDSERYGGLTLIDGHLRVDTYKGEWPVLILDVNDAEADYLLATLDPIAALAKADAEKLDVLLRGIATGEAGVQSMLADLAKDAGLYALLEGDPDPLDGLVPDADRYREQYGVIVICEDERDQERVYNELSLAGYNCKVVVT